MTHAVANRSSPRRILKQTFFWRTLASQGYKPFLGKHLRVLLIMKNFSIVGLIGSKEMKNSFRTNEEQLQASDIGKYAENFQPLATA